jgi:hypothetical protein
MNFENHYKRNEREKQSGERVYLRNHFWQLL